MPIPRVTLGRTGLTVSRIALGAGPVSGLMTGTDTELQQSVFRSAIDHGINWIDTAAGYGNGQSETSIGRCLSMLPPDVRSGIHVATKFRFDPASSISLREQVHVSLEGSLERLGVSSVTLLQVHNGITDITGQEPSSISTDQFLCRGGLADELHQLQSEGLCRFIGLTGTGTPDALRTVVRSGEFDTLQVPYNLLNPSAGCVTDDPSVDRSYGNILDDCHRLNLGAFAIRVFAAGAILSQPPSAHTLKTPYFPVALYERDAEAARSARGSCSADDFARRAIQFVLSHPAVHSAIIGFGTVDHVVAAAAATR